MNPAPNLIGNAKVICYLIINLLQRTGGESRQIVQGFAICKYEQEPGYYLFSCDEHWMEFADTYHETIDDALEQAEFEFSGISNFLVYK